MFEKLFAALQQTEVVKRPDRNNTKRAFDNTAFFESYFSNYIEGTIFEVEEALQIIQTQKPIPARDEDSHDILATYQLVSNRTEMNITPGSAAQLIDIMQYRHKVLLSARPNKQPGAFKDRNNRAGETMFVDYRFVKGTLKKGFEYYAALTSPFAKAVFMMFMISEVHPFLDGNGRLARIMMNAELVKGGEAKIIIPTVYRIDYLTALRRLTRQGDPAVFIKMMQRAHEFSENIDGEDRDALQAWLTTCNAFSDDSDTILRFGYRG